MQDDFGNSKGAISSTLMICFPNLTLFVDNITHINNPGCTINLNAN
jgi:hypothetical protein